MKKYMVLVIAALLGAVLYVRHLERRVAAPPPAAAPEKQEEGGVPLPPDAKVLSLPEFTQEAPRPTSRLSGTAQQPAPVITPLAVSADPCVRETKVKDVIASHRKWALLQKDKVKTPEEQARSYAINQAVGEEGVKSLVSKIGAHQACLSLAADKNLCGALPKGESEADINLSRTCAEKLYPVGFVGYSMGKAGYSHCSMHLKYALSDAGQHIRESEFCDMVKGGPPVISDRLCPRMPQGLRAVCREAFPKDISGCSDEECRTMWGIYLAIKNDSPGYLSYELQPLVSAMVDKKEEHCRPLAEAIVQGYCSVKSGIDHKLMQIEMTRKQAEMDKQIRAEREKRPSSD